MCGIVGFNWEDNKIVKKMAEVISHRGPDDSGAYCERGMSLGHRRLSILDLSQKGHQPMLNEQKNVVVVFNGEIYNYPKLKEELEKKKHKFISQSDTEAIIHGYEEFGEKIFSMLEGMFAIALWDTKKKKLFLARDRIGKKPIYYYYDGKSFIFASEIKAILIHEEVERTIDYQCLCDYLSLRYSPGNRTMFERIKKIPPSSYLILEGTKILIKKHWHFPEFSGKKIPDEKIIDNLIRNSIKKRLMSDVPLGVFLSGGLDSSAITSYMSELTDEVNTFSIGFSDNTDESKYAELVAKKFNTNHKQIFLDSDILKNLPKIAWHFDEPLADPASLPTYTLCHEVSKKVKVALSGEGGDEVFGGYHTFNYIKHLNFLRKTPRFLGRGLLAPSLNLASKAFNYPQKQMLNLASEIICEPKNITRNQEKLFYFPFETSDKKEILTPEIIDHYNIENPITSYLSASNNPWNNVQKYYFEDWLPNDLLMKVDKMSMAHSLEVRTPFLDTDLIKYFSAIDNSYKQDRSIFRRVISKRLPKEIIKRKKQGFTLPLTNWFTKKEFSERLIPHLDDLKKRKLFDEAKLNHILTNPKEFKNDHRIWSLLNLELWNKIYQDNINPAKIIV